MEGRDTGTAAYQRAADYVAARFKAAHLQPAGDNGTYFQTVPMHQIDVDPDATTFAYTRPGGLKVDFPFLQEISITASASLPLQRSRLKPADLPRLLRQGSNDRHYRQIRDLLRTERAGNPHPAPPNASPTPAMAELSAFSPSTTSPSSSSRHAGPTPTRAGHAAPPDPASGQRQHTIPILVMRLSSLAFSKLIAGNDHEPGSYLMAAAGHLPLPSFDLPGTFTVHTADRAERHLLTQRPRRPPGLRSKAQRRVRCHRCAP